MSPPILFLLLLVGVGSSLFLLRFRWVALVPAVAGIVELLALGDRQGPFVHATLGSLAGAIGFLLAAGPLGWLLDRLGFFTLVASKIPRRSVGAYLWGFAAVITAIFNLDASIVLLTPLYFRYAQSIGSRVEPFVFQPVCLSLLASSPLVGSNLTNLVVLGSLGLSPVNLLDHLLLPTLVGCLVGYLVWRRVFSIEGPIDVSAEPIGGSELVSKGEVAVEQSFVMVVGVGVSALMLVGMVVGKYVGVAPWMVVLLCDLILMVALRRFPLSQLPLLPALAVGGLGVTAVEFGSRVDLVSLFHSGSNLNWLTISVGSGVLGGLMNNIPAVSFLIAGTHGQIGNQVWPMLLGINFLPGIVVTGTLANLLWIQLIGQLGVKVTMLWFARRMLLIVGLGYLSAVSVMIIGRVFGI